MATTTSFLPHYRASHAIIVGVNAYAIASPLRSARQDAEALAATLQSKHGFPSSGITLLLDDAATGIAIRKAVASLTADRVSPDDRVLFFFAGHGFTQVGFRGEVGYLVPCDGDPRDTTSLVRWDELTKGAEVIPAKHMLFIVDACYGGLVLTRGAPGGTARFLKDMLVRYSRQAIAAGKANQTVSDGGGPRAGHSVFTGHLLNALEGKAAFGDGVVTASGVMAYVLQMVATDRDSHQTPHYGHLDGDGEFVFMGPGILDEAEPAKTHEDEVLVFLPAESGGEVLSSAKGLVADVKEFVPDPGMRIKLDDLINETATEVLARLAASGLRSDDPLPSTSSVVDRARGYLDSLGDLPSVCAILGKWANEEQAALMANCLYRFAEANQEVGGYDIWLGLRWLPAAALYYSAGVAAASAGNYRLLGAMWRARSHGRVRARELDQAHVFTAINQGFQGAREGFRLIPEHERQFVPCSEYLYRALQPILEDTLRLGGAYDVYFDRFEILNALAHADQRIDQNMLWGPPGRFAWKRSGIGQDPYAQLGAEMAAGGTAWEVLRSGICGGSHARFKQVYDAYGVFIGKLGFY